MMLELLNTLKFKIKGEYIIQFGTIRSGSTLVYNTLKNLYPNWYINKTHKLPKIKSKYLILSYRNPLDCIASSLMRNQEEINNINIKLHISEYLNNGGKEIESLLLKKGILKLKYEEIWQNHDFLIEEIERYIGKKSKINLEDVKKSISLENSMKIASKFSQFNEYDNKTKIHGKHISIWKGYPNSHKKIFNQEQIDFITSKISSHLETLGY